MSKIFFFRHAQASYGAANYDQLSPLGEQQSAELGKYLVQQNFHFDKIFVGPLERQKHTFQIVSEIFQKNNKTLPNPVILEELKEHKGPEVSRVVLPELMKTNPQVKKWYAEIAENPKLMKRNSLLSFQYFMEQWSLGKVQVEGIESWADFRISVRKGLNTIFKNTEKGETIGAFSSGGTISSITAEALNLKDETRIAAMNFSVRNTSFTSFHFSKSQFNLLSFNELPHLEKEMITFV